MINIEQKLIEACASIRTINTYQRFLRDALGTTEVHSYVSGVGGGEVHVYDNGEVEVSIRNSGLIVLNIYSLDLGYDHSYIIS